MDCAIYYEEGVGFKIQPGLVLNDVPIIEVVDSDTNDIQFYPDLLAICKLLDTSIENLERNIETIINEGYTTI